MSFSYNRVMLAGNLTRDPQVRFFANERAVADFGLAINRKYKTNDGQMKEETTFVDVEAWGRTAELVGQYLQTLKAKGISVLLIEQKLTIAMAISDRALVMGHGTIVFQGTPESLRADAYIRKEWLEV